MVSYQDDRDLAEVIRVLERDENEGGDDFGGVVHLGGELQRESHDINPLDNEQFNHLYAKDAKEIVNHSMAPTTVALIRKAIKESGSRTGQAIWTYVKP